MNEKQQQLTFGKGITNVPSDAICSDNTLEESLGMVYDNGEHRVIQKPVDFITSTAVQGSFSNFMLGKVVYVHRVDSQERFIAVGTVTDNSAQGAPMTFTNCLIWGTVSSKVFTLKGVLKTGLYGMVYSSSMQFTSIGKTFIVSGSDGLHYYLWKDSSYSGLGDKIPEPNVTFKIKANITTSYEDRFVHLKWDNNDSDHYWDTSIIDGRGNIVDQEAWNDLVIGFYRRLCNDASEKKCFTRPFFARYALELYDGEYTYISNPVALFPTVGKNGFASPAVDGSFNTREFLLGYAHMYFKSTTDYSSWKDLVKGITIFVSPQIDIVDTEADQILEYAASNDVLWNGVFFENVQYESPQYAEVLQQNDPDGQETYYNVFKFYDSASILSKLKETSNFYKLCDIGTTRQASWKEISELTSSYAIKNITTQTQLSYDDYYSRCKLNPSFIYSYNMRLNIANVSRSFFDGFTQFLPYYNESFMTAGSRTYQIYVNILSEDGERIVKKEITTEDFMGLYFYYPDQRATRVRIFSGGNLYYDFQLEEHPFLHGAYYFGGLPTGQESDSPTSGYEPTVSNTPETLPSYLIQSEVNNPFIFKADGYHRVGTGSIKAMSTVTQALSEGQFGQYPLLVFSTDGIWAMSVDKTGIYLSSSPMSREVCSNPKSITQTDGAVFFASKKGLMVIIGNQVKCVSEQLSGKTNFFVYDSVAQTTDIGNFVSFLETAFIAYDYRDSLLWIFDGSHSACWVYSIKSGTFGKYYFNSRITNVVNYYPDYLMQDSSSHVHSLLQRPDINDDATTNYTGHIVTRPLKLENALALKSIKQVRHIHDMNTSASLVLSIFASNNLKNWVELSSLRGTPWKYYRLKYDFEHLKATDRFSGTVVVTEERRTNKLR